MSEIPGSTIVVATPQLAGTGLGPKQLWAFKKLMYDVQFMSGQ